ncbi:MAG: PEGA domain-containing protein [Candidatus Poribacteria bacterium]|nr:PEGA domain-containing protein [Candidatus Poribacteria bacterium]
MRSNVSGQIILTSNREGERLSRLSAETESLATQLQQIQQDRDRAERSQDATEIAETKRRQAELENRLRQAKADQEAEEMREQQAKKQRQQEARQRELQAIRDQEVRQQARQEQARKERLQRQIEAERRKREAERAASMSLGEALDKAEQIRLQIDAVRPQVESEIEEQIAAIPKPQRIRTPGKGEFEKQVAYQARVDRDKQRGRDATNRYNREVRQISSKLEAEVRTRKEAYQQALQPLTEADPVFNEGELDLDLGAYDAQEETFPNATISTKQDTPLRDSSWDFAVPVDQAKKLKSSVQNGTVEIRLHARLNLQSRNGVKTLAIVIKVYAQNSKQFVYPTLRLSISSNPSRADVFIDGQRVGTTPFDQSQLPLGRHEVKVSKRFSLDYGDYQPSETKTVEVSPGDQSVWFDLPTPPSLRVTSSPSGATVMVNEQRMGTTPSTLNLPPGEHAIQLSGGPAYTQPMEAVSLPPNGETDLSFDLRLRPGYRIKRRMGMLWSSSLVPGWGQFHGGRGGWGSVFMVTAAGSVWRFRNAHREATKAIADYDTLVGTYREAFTPDEFDEPRFDEAKVLYNQVKKAQSTERSFAIRVAVVWGVNLAHTYLTRLKSPSIVQQVTPTPRFEVVAKPNPQSPNIRLAMRF